MEVDDEATSFAYRDGGMEAVKDLLVEEADGMPETPFWWPETPSEDDIKRLVTETDGDE